MIALRKAEERGHLNFGWLDTYHTFSFGSYHDPNHMGFRSLRVLNHDHVKPGNGFEAHPHRDMEIVTYILAGEISHRDSMGNEEVIREGEIQRMTAGTGILHSEHNHGTKPLELLQIWILPQEQNLEPSYEQKTIQRRGGWQLLVSPDGTGGSLKIHQRVKIWEGNFKKGETLELPLELGESAWVQGIKGHALIEGTQIGSGDGAAITETKQLSVEGKEDGRILVFDMA